MKVNKYRNMDEQALDKEADLMATRAYLSRGYFGGKAVVVKGVVTDRRYFPFEAIKTKYYNWLKKEQLKSDKELKEEVKVSLT